MFAGQHSRRAFLAMLGAVGVAGRVAAQAIEARPIRLIVGFTPGGSADFVARLVAPRLAETLGTTVVVENRAGASGTIAGTFVARSAPDGLTLLMGSASPVVISPQTLQRAPFNPLTDLAAINTIGLTPQVIAVHPGTGIHTLKDLLGVAKTRQVSLASSGVGGMTHLAIELLVRASRSNIVHVPYKGAGPAIADALAGHVQGVVADATPLLPLLQDGRMRPIAVTSEKRVSFMPQVQTVAEEFAGFGAANWAGVLAPAGTPGPVLARLHAALAAVVAREDVKAQLQKAGFEPYGMDSADAFQRFVAAEHARWGRLIKELNIVTTD